MKDVCKFLASGISLGGGVPGTKSTSHAGLYLLYIAFFCFQSLAGSHVFSSKAHHFFISDEFEGRGHQGKKCKKITYYTGARNLH